MPIDRLALLGLLSAFLVGCSIYVRPSDRYLQTNAYLYGRFHIEGQSMSFAILCRDGNTYTIDFSSSSAVQMVALPPSTCQLDKVLYGGAVQQMARFRLIRNEILDPGGVYYVGDFQMSGTRQMTESSLFYTRWHETWRAESIRDNYAATTRAMKAAYPQFASAPTENRVTH